MSRQVISSGKPLEPVLGYSRAVRVGPYIHVAGTTGALPPDTPGSPGDAYAQAVRALDIICEALERAGATSAEVVRTRVFLTNIDDWEAVGRAHHEVFGDVLPASSFIGISSLIGPESLVEIEADAIVESPEAASADG